MPFTAPTSASVKLVTSADTSVPVLLPSTTSSTIDVTVLSVAVGAAARTDTAMNTRTTAIAAQTKAAPKKRIPRPSSKLAAAHAKLAC
jgi:hypothetical protein